MRMSSGELRIGELATRAGVSIDTIRYYERRRLLPRAERSRGGFRLYTPETVDRLRFIKQAQEIGFSLDEIGDLLATGDAAECRRCATCCALSWKTSMRASRRCANSAGRLRIIFVCKCFLRHVTARTAFGVVARESRVEEELLAQGDLLLGSGIICGRRRGWWRNKESLLALLLRLRY